MKENVGRADQALRAIFGPLLLAAGYAWMGGRQGRTTGLLAMIGGALVIESAITRTCPLNHLLGIDTRRFDQPAALQEIPSDVRQQASTAPISAAEAAASGREEERAARRRGPIDYAHFVSAAFSLSFILDEQTADAAVRAVLGILASRLEESEARRLAASLPEELRYAQLRGDQTKEPGLSVDQYYGSLAKQFGITHDQAQVLAITILRLVKESLDTNGMREIEKSLPDEWTQLIERV